MPKIDFAKPDISVQASGLRIQFCGDHDLHQHNSLCYSPVMSQMYVRPDNGKGKGVHCEVALDIQLEACMAAIDVYRAHGLPVEMHCNFSDAMAFLYGWRAFCGPVDFYAFKLWVIKEYGEKAGAELNENSGRWQAARALEKRMGV